MKLYEIDKAILDTIDPETGEVLDPQRLDALQMERRAKVENVALWIKNLESDVDAYIAEMERFAARRKAAERKIESLKAYLYSALNGEKFETEKCEVTWRKSKAVSIADEDALRAWAVENRHPELLTIQPPKINKAEVKRAIQYGLEVKGAELVERLNMQIK